MSLKGRKRWMKCCNQITTPSTNISRVQTCLLGGPGAASQGLRSRSLTLPKGQDILLPSYVHLLRVLEFLGKCTLLWKESMEAFPRYFLERPTAAEACPKQLGMPVRPGLWSWRSSARGRDWAWGTIVYCYQGQIIFPFNFPLENKSSFFVFGGLSFNLRFPSQLMKWCAARQGCCATSSARAAESLILKENFNDYHC